MLAKMTRSARPLAGLALIAAAIGVSAAPAQAKVPPVTPGSRYLALGDSVTFGYEEASVVPKPNYKNAASFLGYPEQLGAELRLRVANASCPGETSSSLINPSAPSNGCENGPGAPHSGYRVLFPLHVKYSGSQLAYGVSYLKKHRGAVRLVSLMIGANDLFRCQETTKDACLSKSEQHAVLSTVAKNVKHILASVRNRAHYRGQLVILNYYSLNYTNSTITGIVSTLNSTVDDAAKPFHVAFANGFGEFKTASKHSGANPCTAGLLTQLGSPAKCGVHPSYAGQALLAQAVGKAIRL